MEIALHSVATYQSRVASGGQSGGSAVIEGCRIVYERVDGVSRMSWLGAE